MGLEMSKGIRFLGLTTASLVLLAGCGKQNIMQGPFPQQGNYPQQNMGSVEYQQIMSTLQQMQADINALKQNPTQVSSVPAFAQSPSQTSSQTAPDLVTNPAAPTAAAQTAPTQATAVASTPAASAPAPAPSADGRTVLNQVLQSITQSAGFNATVQKYEKGIQSGEVSEAKIQITGKSPNRTRIEIIQHATKKGLKVAYTLGDASINIRPNGMLSLVSVSKPMNDPLVLSPNGMKPDEIDFYALAKRMADPAYQAELVGKTTMAGKAVHILKISSARNSLNPIISHEYIGFDPNSHQLLLWEAYSNSYQSGKTPFLRMSVESFSALSSVSEEQLKV